MRTVNLEGINEDDATHFKCFTQTSYSGHKKLPTAVAWSPSGDKLVVAETSVKIWSFDLVSGCQKITESKLHDNNVQTIKFGTNNLFASLSKQSLRFWDVREAPLKPGKIQKRNKSDFVSFCWNITGNNVENASEQNLKYCLLTKDSTLNLMDFRNQSKPLATVNLKTSSITSYEICEIGWDQTNSLFLCAGGQNSIGAIILLNGQNFEPIPEGVIECHCARINDFAFSPDQSKIVLASDDSLVEVHEFPEFICERAYSNKTDSSVRKVSFSYDGKYVAAGSEGSTVDIYNIQYGGEAHRIATETSAMVVQWHPKRQVLCYIDEKRKVGKNQKAEDTYIHIFQPAM